MIQDPVEMLREGVIGTFQPLVEPALKKRFQGHIKIGPEDAVIAVVASKKRDQGAEWTHDPSNSQIITGITEAGTILALIRSIRRSTTRGDYAVTVVRWHATSVLVNVPFDEVDSDTVTAAQLLYLGLDSWSGGLEHVDEPILEEGVAGWRIEVRPGQQQRSPIDENFDLTLKHDWTLTGPNDNRSLQKPLKIGVRSRGRRPLAEHIDRLDAVHALLSVAHRLPVTAATGMAQLAPESRRRAALWDSAMTTGVPHPGSNEFPVFTLADINGLPGLAAWVNTCLTKRRAVAPVIRHRLFEDQTPESRLLYTAAALEFWVASNARNNGTPWARKVQDAQVPKAVGISVSDVWRTWIGDSDRWASLFYSTYVQLKHTAADIDAEVVDALEFSGRWLLTASILDQCAGSSAPSKRIFSGGLPYSASESVRRILDHAPIPSSGTRR